MDMAKEERRARRREEDIDGGEHPRRERPHHPKATPLLRMDRPSRVRPSARKGSESRVDVMTFAHFGPALQLQLQLLQYVYKCSNAYYVMTL